MFGAERQTDTMTRQEKAFSQALGARVASLRRQQDLTQAQLGELAGISQQKVAAVELGTRRLAIAELPAMAKALGVTLEELIGEEPKRAKRGPTPKLQQQLERVASLPKARQRLVSEMLDAVLQQAGR